MNVFQRISNMEPELSASQRQIAEYILEHYKEAAFLNSVDMAQAVGVSNPTVIRFAKSLGYKGYHEFQAALQDAVQSDLSSLERLSYLRTEPQQDAALNMFLLEAENLSSVYAQLDREALKGAIDLLSASEEVFIFGRQISEAPALFASYTLGKILDDVRLVENWSLWDEAAYRAHPDRCCALVIALPRYPVLTLEFLQLLHQHDIPSVVITGEASTFPLPEMATYLLTAPVRYISMLDPISPVFCLINCLAIGIIEKLGQKATKAMYAFEQYVTNCQVYHPGSSLPNSVPIETVMQKKKQRRTRKEKS